MNVCCSGLLAVATVCSAAQQNPQPPPPPPTAPSSPTTYYPAPPRPSTRDVNPYEFSIPFNIERLAGPENVTKPVSIAEFETFLQLNRGKSDAKLAELIAGMALTERATLGRLQRWKAGAPGPQTRDALTAVADASAFLALPAEDRSTGPTPSMADQRRMMAALGNYLGKVLPNLPNFLATRHTTLFEDWPSHVDWPGAKVADSSSGDAARMRNRPLYTKGRLKTSVTYRDGHEVEDKSKARSEEGPYGPHLTSLGEFGPILTAIAGDAARSNLQWSEWEHSDQLPQAGQSVQGALAVFRFDVPQEHSHYALREPGSKVQKFSAYRGEMAIRPSDGAIMRVTVVAALESQAGIETANLQVEYGSVEIGGKSYICPVHVVALAKMPIHSAHPKQAIAAAPLQTQVNDVNFEQYHVFRSDSRIESVQKPE